MEQDETFLLSVLAHVPDAVVLEGLPEALDVRYHAPHPNLAAGRLDLTNQRFGETRAPGSDQTVEAQDLAFSEDKAQRGSAAITSARPIMYVTSWSRSRVATSTPADAFRPSRSTVTRSQISNTSSSL